MRPFQLVGGIVAAAVVTLGATSPASGQPAETTATPAAAAALRAKGLDQAYNLDHAEALATFKQLIAEAPDSPVGYRLAAATLWIKLLFEQGAVTVDDYLGQARADARRLPPTAALAAEFHDYLRRAQTLAERRAREHPDDPDSHFQLGAAFGFEASYTATVEGRLLASVGPARRAYAEHSRTLALSPARKDAGLLVGMYRCAVAELSGVPRLFAWFSGFSGDRAGGLRLVEDAARYPSDVQANALFTLVLLYNRAGRYDAALAEIRQLQARYPRNRLLLLEAGGTALRARRPAEARAWLEQGLAMLASDPRPRALGEEARWHYTYGAALVSLGEATAADRELRAALAGATRDWLRGRIHRELGRLADLAGNRPAARDEYQEAMRLCREDRDGSCVDESRALLKTPYR
jgi:tetratricopeptide (TPR) repeat protein